MIDYPPRKPQAKRRLPATQGQLQARRYREQFGWTLISVASVTKLLFGNLDSQ